MILPMFLMPPTCTHVSWLALFTIGLWYVAMSYRTRFGLFAVSYFPFLYISGMSISSHWTGAMHLAFFIMYLHPYPWRAVVTVCILFSQYLSGPDHGMFSFLFLVFLSFCPYLHLSRERTFVHSILKFIHQIKSFKCSFTPRYNTV